MPVTSAHLNSPGGVMASEPVDIVHSLRAVRYDGTNSNEIAALDEFDFNNATEVNGVWAFNSPPDSSAFAVETGDWIIYTQNQVMVRMSNTDFDRFYRCNVLCTDVRPSVQALGAAVVPPLDPSESANINVVMVPAMPDAGYAAYATKFAGEALADLDIVTVTVVDEDTVTVEVQNTGSQTMTQASLLVHAVA